MPDWLQSLYGPFLPPFLESHSTKDSKFVSRWADSFCLCSLCIPVCIVLPFMYNLLCFVIDTTVNNHIFITCRIFNCVIKHYCKVCNYYMSHISHSEGCNGLHGLQFRKCLQGALRFASDCIARRYFEDCNRADLAEVCKRLHMSAKWRCLQGFGLSWVLQGPDVRHLTT